MRQNLQSDVWSWGNPKSEHVYLQLWNHWYYIVLCRPKFIDNIVGICCMLIRKSDTSKLELEYLMPPVRNDHAKKPSICGNKLTSSTSASFEGWWQFWIMIIIIIIIFVKITMPSALRHGIEVLQKSCFGRLQYTERRRCESCSLHWNVIWSHKQAYTVTTSMKHGIGP